MLLLPTAVTVGCHPLAPSHLQQRRELCQGGVALDERPPLLAHAGEAAQLGSIQHPHAAGIPEDVGQVPAGIQVHDARAALVAAAGALHVILLQAVRCGVAAGRGTRQAAEPCGLGMQQQRGPHLRQQVDAGGLLQGADGVQCSLEVPRQL